MALFPFVNDMLSLVPCHNLADFCVDSISVIRRCLHIAYWVRDPTTSSGNLLPWPRSSPPNQRCSHSSGFFKMLVQR